MAVQLRERMTVEQFDAWVRLPENADQDFELIGGGVYPVVSNSYSSQVAMRLAIRLGGFIVEHQLGHVTGADGGFMVAGERYSPDFGYIAYHCCWAAR